MNDSGEDKQYDSGEDKQCDSSEDKQSFFVVRNPDNAILVFCGFGISIFLGIFIVSKLFTDNNWVCSFLLAYGQITRISALSLFIVLSIEGVDIMKSRYVESKKRTDRLIEQARKEEREKAYQRGFEAGKKSASVDKPSKKGSSPKRGNKPK